MSAGRVRVGMREAEFIDWIRRQAELDPQAVPVGPGDDCAVVVLGGEKVLVTTDQALDGVHFILSACGPEAAGQKAMARSLSDIAAMAGVPLAAVATVALPKGLSREDGEAIYRGLRRAADEFRCPVVGGDVGTWQGALAIGVTVFGRPAGGDAVLRSGAKAGDAICVTGRLGGAWRTRRHLEFTPRINEAIALAASCELHAMIDLSDGPATDLHHLCRESGVGAEVLAAAVPVHPDAADLAGALSDGEDYELLFALPAAQAEALTRQQPLRVAVTRIGTVVAGEGVTLVHPDGRREALPASGWEHST